MSLSSELETAINLAYDAGKIQLDFISKNPQIAIKIDRSPVTEVDKKCEELIRDALLKEFSSDGFLGEETGSHEGSSGRKWIVDPLDGTRPYIRQIPTYSVLIALEEDGIPVLGVIYLPSMNILCYGTKGNGSFVNKQPIRISSIDRMDKAIGSGLGFVERSEEESGKKLLKLMKTWDYSYGFMDAYSYVCCASGKLDLCVNLLDKPWDCASAACIIEEAGGRYTDIYGAKTVYNGSVVFSNGIIHDQIIEFFNS